MSEVLFGQSYYLRFDPKLWEAMQPYPPLGTMYAASLLRREGYTVALFDAMLAGSEEEWRQALERERPRYAVLFEDNFNYLSKMCLLRMREAAYTMIAMAREAGCRVLVCGSDASDHAEEYLQQGADFILVGEGEATLVELLAALSGRVTRPLAEIAGLVFRESVGGLDSRRLKPRQHQRSLPSEAKEESAKADFVEVDAALAAGTEFANSIKVIYTPRRPDLADLDGLPFPAWDLVDVERYRGIWLERHGYFSMNMVTTRGCPFHCNWCAKPIWGQRYHSRSPENVAAEMKWLKETYQPDHIWFADDILGLKPGWLEGFARAVEREGMRIPFKSLNRADLLLRGETIPALARAGAEIVWIGAESGSQQILDAMEKGTRVEQIGEAARRLRAAGVRVGFFLQFGYPGEELEDIEETLAMVRELAPDDIGISVSYPLPGTRFYVRVREQMGSKQNWVDSQDLAMMYQGPFSTEFYRKLYGLVHKEFRMRKTWRELRRGKLSSPRRVGSMLYQWASLPGARRELRALAQKLANGRPLRGLRPELDPEAAARPTPQTER